MTTASTARQMRAQIAADFIAADFPPRIRADYARKGRVLLAAFDALLSFPLDAAPFGPNGLAVAAGVTIPEILDVLPYLIGERSGLLSLRFVLQRADGTSTDLPPASIQAPLAGAEVIDPVTGEAVADWMKHVVPILDRTDRLMRMTEDSHSSRLR